MIPTNVATASGENDTTPMSSVWPVTFSPMPMTRMSEQIIMFLESEKSIFASTMVLRPLAAIMPYRISDAPPMTGAGMVAMMAPNLVKIPSTMAKIAASASRYGL